MSTTAATSKMANWSVRKTLIVAAILSIILGSLAGLGVVTLAHPAPSMVIVSEPTVNEPPVTVMSARPIETRSTLTVMDILVV